MAKPVLRSPALRQGLLLVCAGVGALVLVAGASLALVPMLVVGGVIAFWLIAALLVVWGGIEVMAALERWLERDPRFQR